MSVSVNSPGNGRQFLSLLQGALDSPTPRLPVTLLQQAIDHRHTLRTLRAGIVVQVSGPSEDRACCILWTAHDNDLGPI